jgi:hypothetical protein
MAQTYTDVSISRDPSVALRRGRMRSREAASSGESPSCGGRVTKETNIALPSPGGV